MDSFIGVLLVAVSIVTAAISLKDAHSSSVDLYIIEQRKLGMAYKLLGNINLRRNLSLAIYSFTHTLLAIAYITKIHSEIFVLILFTTLIFTDLLLAVNTYFEGNTKSQIKNNEQDRS